MGQYDIAFKRLAARRPADFAWLALGVEPETIEVVSEELPAVHRAADFVARLRSGEARVFLLHVECERGPDPEMDGRMLEYHVGLYRREGLPVVSVVLRLEGPGPARSVIERVLAADGFESLRFRYRRLDLASLAAEELLDAAHPALWALVPLTRGGESAAILRQAVQQIRACEAPQDLRADLLATMAIFAGVKATRELLYPLVRREEMKESVVYQDILLEGRAEGKIEGKREALLRLLRGRFGTLDPQIEACVLALADPARLDEIFDRAIVASSIADLGM